MDTAASKKSIITIAGQPGSGKSTTAKGVAKILEFEHFSSGDLFRALAKERGLDLMQANLSAEQNTEMDNLVDGRLQEMGLHEDRKVIDSRMAWHWMPQSFKVYLDLDMRIAAQRILDGMDEQRLKSEHVHRDPEEYAEILKERHASEVRRYRSLYDLDPFEHRNYDLVVDTGAFSIDEVIARVVLEFRKWLDQSAAS